ncbi:MAG: pyridoxamine 5'-phosphate oxidase family protein [Caldilineales bacterium]
MDNAELARLRTFLAQHTTMTLATVGPDGAPQAAAVFYAADEQLNLFFLSSPTSRHSRNVQQDPRVAATIHDDGQAWQQICGLQIEGRIQPVEGAGLLHAARVFAARFDFLRGPLADPDDAPADLRGPLASNRFYVLRPVWIRLIDNRLGFGHKEEWTFDGDG